MSMNGDRKRLVNSRILPVAHFFSAERVEEIKYLLMEQEDSMEMVIYEGLSRKGHPVLHIVFRNVETKEIDGEINDSHPCPPFDDC